jgi:hypothetical protein
VHKEDIGPLLKNYEEFQDSNNMALNQAQGSSEHRPKGLHRLYPRRLTLLPSVVFLKLVYAFNMGMVVS